AGLQAPVQVLDAGLRPRSVQGPALEQGAADATEVDGRGPGLDDADHDARRQKRDQAEDEGQQAGDDQQPGPRRRRSPFGFHGPGAWLPPHMPTRSSFSRAWIRPGLVSRVTVRLLTRMP